MDTSIADPIRGRCLCGQIHYELLERPIQTTLCHCEDCRRASGAHAVAWSFCRKGTIRWTSGQPKTIYFANRERSFCGACGTPLMFFDPAIPELFEVSTNSLNNPSEFEPIDECWLDDSVNWHSKVGHLPKYSKTAPLPNL